MEKKQVRQSLDTAKRGMSEYNSRLGDYGVSDFASPEAVTDSPTEGSHEIVSSAFVAARTYSAGTLPESALSLIPHHVTQHNWTPALLFLLLEMVGLGIWRWSRRAGTTRGGDKGHVRASSLGFSSSKPASVGLFGRRKAVKMV